MEQPDWRPCASRRPCLSSASRRTSRCEQQKSMLETHNQTTLPEETNTKDRLQMKTLPVLKPHSELWRGLPHLFSQNYWDSPFPSWLFSPPRLPLFLVSPPCSLRPPLLHGPQHYSTTTVNIITLNLLFSFPMAGIITIVQWQDFFVDLFYLSEICPLRD